MQLPIQNRPVNRQVSVTSSNRIFPSSDLVNSFIKAALKDRGVSYFDDTYICGAALVGVLNTYNSCVGRGSSERGCALSAANFIADNLCGVYCNCKYN
jgi:hypothetical protein